MTDRDVLKDRARAMRHEPTVAERKLWDRLKGGRLGGMKFRRQVPLGGYIADFACFYPKIIVECDGGQHADSAYDATRDAWLRAGFQGHAVLEREHTRRPRQRH
jgi:very-short-patch-repair endonuclease